jgi:predicted transcriptional regulator
MRYHGTLKTGEERPQSKLSNEQAAEIRGSADSHSILSKRYGVSCATIQRVKAGKVYKDPETPLQKAMRSILLAEKDENTKLALDLIYRSTFSIDAKDDLTKARSCIENMLSDLRADLGDPEDD